MRYVAVLQDDNEIILQGDVCVTSLADLYCALADSDATEIEITKAFAEEFFTYSALCDFVESCATLVPNTRVYVDDTVYDTTFQAVQDLRMYNSAEEFIYALECNPTRTIKIIQALCDFYSQSHDENTLANNKIATMMIQLEDLQKELTIAKREKEVSDALYTETYSKLHALVSRVNFRFEKTVDLDEMFLLRENQFNKILYVKEITRVHFTDTLLYYLAEIIKTLYGMPARTVVIGPYYSYGAERMYPGFKPSWQLTYRDVYSEDIYMPGFQPKVMSNILKNANHINYLIVLDRGGYRSEHIQGSNVSYVYTVSDFKDIPEGITPDRIISYEDTTMSIPYIENFDTLSLEDRVQKYSSMKVTKSLLNILEEV